MSSCQPLPRDLAPRAMQIESAGGESSGDGKPISALDIPISFVDQRTQVCYGSRGEVKRFEEYMYGEYRVGQARLGDTVVCVCVRGVGNRVLLQGQFGG